ncbi:PREDICTED: extensin-2-like [Lupinus angustifolius]|uniref:extensin-2-like n=1 Tax=Lupinus angustifolius TaxID=3871 RepID=UPI00092F818F|nr:PREDICTED: extensin-2-like [Lupinus angustifolius]
MANSLRNFLPSLFIIILVSTLSTILEVSAINQTISTVVKDQQVPCTMCTECENPCQPLPPPPPIVIECPPPPSPPPPSLPPPPPPPAVVECPPPPKPACPDNCEIPPYPPGSYYSPGKPYSNQVPHGYYNYNGAKMVQFYFPYYFAFLCHLV